MGAREVLDNAWAQDLILDGEAGLGLKSMHTRAARLGGTVEVIENNTQGVLVTVSLPMKDARLG